MDAAIYARISLDTTGQGLGVERQLQDCRAKAEALGWTVVGEYVDNDVSATKSKPRPEYDRLMADLETGQVQALVVYAVDRLTRKPAELEAFIDLADRKHISLANVSGDVDLSNANGRMVARILGALARQEAERMGERRTRANQQKVESGKHLGGGRYRTYGYTREFEVIEDEAAVVREMFARRAAGESCTAIGADLSARKLLPVSGRRWSASTISRTLSRPGYAGLQQYHGEIIGKTSYPALVDEATWRLVQSNLVKDSMGTNARKHLLSGILVCSKCMTPMKGNLTHPDNPKKRKAYYKCSQSYGGCGSTSIRIDWCDLPVIEAAMRKFQRQPPTDTIPETSRNFSGELEALERQISEAQEAFTSGGISMADLMPMLKTLRSKRAQVQEEQTVATRATRQPWFIQQRVDFQSMNLSQKRSLISSVISAVVIYPPKGRGRQKPDLSRLEIHYMDGEVFRPDDATTAEILSLETGEPLTQQIFWLTTPNPAAADR